MTFAVIKTGGKQYKVAANDVVKIEKLDAEAGDVVTFDQVLMVGDGASVTVGSPLVAGALVAGELIETSKQATIIIFKKNRRHNYRRRNGHRQLLSSVRITEILVDGAKPVTKPNAALKAKAAAKAEIQAASGKPATRKPATAKAPAAPKAEKPAPKAKAEKPAAEAKAAPKAAAKPKADKPAAEAKATKPAAAKADKPAAAKKPAAKKAAPKADKE